MNGEVAFTICFIIYYIKRWVNIKSSQITSLSSSINSANRNIDSDLSENNLNELTPSNKSYSNWIKTILRNIAKIVLIRLFVFPVLAYALQFITPKENIGSASFVHWFPSMILFPTLVLSIMNYIKIRSNNMKFKILHNHDYEEYSSIHPLFIHLYSKSYSPYYCNLETSQPIHT